MMALASNHVQPSSPIMFFLIFNRSIRNRVDELHRVAMSHVSSQGNVDMIDRSLFEQYRFLGLIYKHNLNAKYEVIFSALDARVKNSVQEYFLHHKREYDRFNQAFEILNSATMKKENGCQREQVSLTGTLKHLITQNMAKEEEQVLPLLSESFSLEEQASLVWQYLCSIPTYVLSKEIPWLSTSPSTREYQDLLECLGMIVPKEKLIQQAIFNWIERKDSGESNTTLTSPMEDLKHESEHSASHPIDDILLWHKAIKKELNETFGKLKGMYLAGDFANQLDFGERLKFVTEICIFHSIAKDELIFPAVYGETLSFHQRAEEESKFNEFWHLIQTSKGVSNSSPEFYSKLCSSADQIIGTITRHFYIEESQVLLLAREKLSIEKQRELLYQSLCMMPLRLIEHALPWLIGTMNNEEAKNFLHNIQLAAPASDTGLVQLFRIWASKIGNRGTCKSSSKSCSNHIKRSFHFHEEFAQSSIPVSALSCNDTVEKNPSNESIHGENLQFVNHSCCLPALEEINNNVDVGRIFSVGCLEQPIDIMFKVHKAIRRDLEYLSVESGKIRNGDEAFLHQFIERFCLLWGLYKAHSNSEDNVIYPALESGEALRNVTHSYSLDHKQEERVFEEITCVLSELSQVLGSLKGGHITKDLSTSTFEFSAAHDSECVKKYYELSTKLEMMCTSIRMVVDQHIFREDHELWPLLRRHFSIEEQNKMVGFVLGTTGAEVLQLLLPWVTSALTQDEQNKMMDILKNVTKNTMFGDWLCDCLNGNSVSISETQKSEACLYRTDILGLGSFQGRMGKVCLDSTSVRTRRENLLRNNMASHWMAARQRLPQLGENLNKRSASFRDHKEKVFGCEHYKRNCKLCAACCGKLFTCNFCHDSISDHSMDRKATMEMMCMRCLNVQPIGPICKTPSCNEFPMAKYYCNICKLFDDERNIYHCPFCNICRVGKGLGVDYFHCMSCNCCLSIRLVDHKCKENCLETSCPVCDEFLFTSSKRIKALPCGHCIHSTCFEECELSPNSCLVCSQSFRDKMRASPELSVMVGVNNEKMRLYNHVEKGQMETSSSWAGDKSEKRILGFARFWADRLYPFLLWLGNSFFGYRRVWRIREGIQNVVEGNKTKDSFLLCCFVLCSLVVFCAMSSFVVLLCLKVVRADKYSLSW